MYNGLLHSHSLLRWILLVLLVVSIFRTYNGWKSRRSFLPTDKRIALFTLIFSHIQLLIGFLLYMVSPAVQQALPDMSAAMKDKYLRFWAVEHISIMILAIMAVTIGYSLSKRAANDSDRFRKLFIFFTIALALILISIPWPFTETGSGRGWF